MFGIILKVFPTHNIRGSFLFAAIDTHLVSLVIILTSSRYCHVKKIHSNKCVKASYCGFILHFPYDVEDLLICFLPYVSSLACLFT